MLLMLAICDLDTTDEAAPLNAGTVTLCVDAVSQSVANVMMCGLPLSAVPEVRLRINFTEPARAASGSVNLTVKFPEAGMVLDAAGLVSVGAWVVVSDTNQPY